ncbi:MAG: SCF ubiquitin ligase complex subunit cdc4 [Peltula sp. TS41687]|nr:MAG: SCF ubiquitin ligase complex subunit cdc4 [Peltula sp. TS41687]
MLSITHAQLNPTSPANLSAGQDASLPSPSLSPVTAALNHGVSISSGDVEHGDDLDSSFELPPPRILGSQRNRASPLDSAGSTASLIARGLREKAQAGGVGSDQSNATLMKIPSMLDTFDAMPSEMQTYMMYQFLRRCSKPTLKIVAGVVNPALKVDFLGSLPLELSHNIVKYLDFQSLCRAAQVSKKWRQMIDGNERAWKKVFNKDGYTLPAGELQRAIREGWGWQIPHGEQDFEKDISSYAVCQSEAGTPTSSRTNLLSTAPADESESAIQMPSAGRPKRRMATKFSARKRLKKKESPRRLFEGNDKSNWMSNMALADAPFAAAAAATKAIPNPPVGLPSLRNLHLFKSLYRRHHLIRDSWMEEDIEPGRVAFRAHGQSVVTWLQFDSDKILTGSDDHTINVYDTKTGALRTRLEGHEGGVWALQYEGNMLVSGSTDRSVRVWDIERGICTHVFQGHTSTVRCLQILLPAPIGYGPDGRPIMMPKEPLILTGSRDSTLKVWKLPQPGDVSYFPSRPLSTDADCPYFLRTLAGHQHSVRAIAAHGDILVSGSYDCTVRVWKISTGETLQRLQGHMQKVYSVVLDHERKRCISGSMDNAVKVWSLETGSVLFSLEGHNSLVGLLDLQHDRLVSAAADSTLRIWDPEFGQCRGILQGHTGAITCFQHDSQKVISGSDTAVKMWNVKTGKFMRDLITDLRGVWQVKFNHRRCVAAVNRDGWTWIEVLDFGCARDAFPKEKLGQRIIVNELGQEISDSIEMDLDGNGQVG